MAKEAPAKKSAAVKPVAKGKISKGDSIECEVCGLSVVVDEIGGIPVREETTLFCCGKPMKTRTTPRKARAAKPTRIPTTLSGEPLQQVAGASGLVPDPKEDVEQQ